MQRCLWVLLLGFALSACHDDNNDRQEQPAEKSEPVPALAVGTYSVSIETDQELPTVGKYYSGTDGTKLVVLNDEQDRAQIVMHYDVATKTWYSNQSDKNLKLEFAHYEKIADQKLSLNELVGSYTLSLADGSSIPVEVKAQGQMISLDQNCSFTAKISENSLANAASYQFTENKCAALKNNEKGYVVVDPDLEPAAFRLLSDTVDSKDLWAFPS
ncbi:hypothetical protein PJ15_0722 [Acinetobacter sp. neg1]|uniref:hypothetical protein n=1 Tax=Acinetobacter TaxID=469 RepID=UPI000542E518|nr:MULTISPECIES: hypothetical protein [Acinetobacter]KHF77667.1 hypothetical protein PJ15_0722 [Acinetobacter sp. neg1]MBJ8481795.1 hypothetical protein [Acinetobacter vivianii]